MKVFIAKLFKLLISACTEILKILEDELPSFLRYGIVSFRPRFTTKMVTPVSPIDKRSDVVRKIRNFCCMLTLFCGTDSTGLDITCHKTGQNKKDPYEIFHIRQTSLFIYI